VKQIGNIRLIALHRLRYYGRNLKFADVSFLDIHNLATFTDKVRQSPKYWV